MDIFQGYTVADKIFNNAGTMVFRVEKNDTKEQFILKTTASNHPSLKQKARYRHEYEILKILKSSGLVKILLLLREMFLMKKQCLTIIKKKTTEPGSVHCI